jgi:hypothetical protein
MRKFLSLTARAALALGCLTYAVWGVDFSRLLAVAASFPGWTMALYAALALASTMLPGLRLRFLVGGHISGLTGLRACLLGLALNNILPARLGEMAKALYLRREASLSLGRSMEAVFWERFFDLNALLVLGAGVAALLGQGMVLYPLLVLVGGAWCFLLLLYWRPGAAHALLRLVPGQSLRLFAAEMLGLLQSNLRTAFLIRLALWTMACWTGYITVYAFGLTVMAGLAFDPALILTVFAVITLGFALPGAPGGMGVYEAAAVLALSWFGVDKDRAFAVGLVMHMLQYLPITAAGLWVLAASGLSVKDLRRQAATTSPGVQTPS